MGHYVYKYVDPTTDEILYIGKNDTDLVSRLNSHKNDPYSYASIYFIEVGSRIESDALESCLIAKYKPKYNKAKMVTMSFSFDEPSWTVYKNSIKKEIRENKKAKRRGIYSWESLVSTHRCMGYTNQEVLKYIRHKIFPEYEEILKTLRLFQNGEWEDSFTLKITNLSPIDFRKRSHILPSVDGWVYDKGGVYDPTTCVMIENFKNDGIFLSGQEYLNYIFEKATTEYKQWKQYYWDIKKEVRNDIQS